MLFPITHEDPMSASRPNWIRLFLRWSCSCHWPWGLFSCDSIWGPYNLLMDYCKHCYKHISFLPLVRAAMDTSSLSSAAALWREHDPPQSECQMKLLSKCKILNNHISLAVWASELQNIPEHSRSPEMLMLIQINIVSVKTPCCENHKDVFTSTSCGVTDSFLLTQVIALLFVHLAVTACCHTLCSGMGDN